MFDVLFVGIGELGSCEVVKVGTNTFLLEPSDGTADECIVRGKQQKNNSRLNCFAYCMIALITEVKKIF